MAQIEIRVSVQVEGQQFTTSVWCNPADTVQVLLQQVLAFLRARGVSTDGMSCLLRGPQGFLAPTGTIADALGPITGAVAVTVQLIRQGPGRGATLEPPASARPTMMGPPSAPAAPPPSPLPQRAPAATPDSEFELAPEPEAESDGEFELTLDEDYSSGPPEPESPAAEDFSIAGIVLENSEAEGDSGSQVVELEEDSDLAATVERPAAAKPEAAVPEAAEAETARTRVGAPAKKRATRHATVRYYERMNPRRMFPLLVVISKEQLQEVVKKDVAQRRSQAFRAALDVEVEVEPVLPGCSCYPPLRRVNVAGPQAVAEFWVVPQVLGQVMNPCVLLRQSGHEIASIPLQMRVANRTITLFLGFLTLVLPFVSALIRHYRLDLASQMEDGFSFYLQVLAFLAGVVSPEILAGVLLALTVVAYMLMRPKKRDVFWDLDTVTPEQRVAEAMSAIEAGRREDGLQIVTALVRTNPDFQPAWFLLGYAHYLNKDHRQALHHYKQALALGAGSSKDYVRAALAASNLGKNQEAYDILKRAIKELPREGVTGVVWYNLACYATRLRHFDHAIECLKMALRRGYRKVKQCLDDPDLAPLRHRADFKGLVAKMAEAAVVK